MKKCPYCGKEYIQLTRHVLNMHPNIAAKIEELANVPAEPTKALTPPISSAGTANIKGNINDLIREKLDTMLNIKIIEMLSKNPNTTLQEIHQAINPPLRTNLEEVKALHDMIYQDKEKDLPYIETGNQWVDIAQQAIPIFKELVEKKHEVINHVGAGKTDNPGILKPICLEVAGNREQPESNSTKPGTSSNTKQ